MKLNHDLPLLTNAGAGSASPERLTEVVEILRAAGIRPRLELLDPGRLAARVRRLVQEGVPAIAVAGGDGTISTAVTALVGTSTVLIPVPLGTLNHFASRYGLDTTDALARAIRQGQVITIPVGVVNGHAFVNNASCGFYPHVVRHRDQLRPGLSKWPAAAIATMVVLARRPVLDIGLAAAGQQIRRTTVAVWVGIGRHSLRLPETGDAAKNGDVLELVLPRPKSRRALLALGFRTWLRLRRHQKPVDAQLETLQVTEFNMISAKPIDVAIDGEARVLAGPLKFECRSDALRVLSLVTPQTS